MTREKIRKIKLIQASNMGGDFEATLDQSKQMISEVENNRITLKEQMHEDIRK